MQHASGTARSNAVHANQNKIIWPVGRRNHRITGQLQGGKLEDGESALEQTQYRDSEYSIESGFGSEKVQRKVAVHRFAWVNFSKIGLAVRRIDGSVVIVVLAVMA